MDVSHSTVLSGSSGQQQRFLLPVARRRVFVPGRIIVASSDDRTGAITNRYDRWIGKVELIYFRDLAHVIRQRAAN